MNTRHWATRLLLGVTIGCGGAALAQTTPNHAYKLRFHPTTGTLPRATLTRDDGAFVYPRIAFETRNCRLGADTTPLLDQAQLWFLSVTALPRPGELRIPTRAGSGCLVVGKFDFHSNDAPPIMPPTGPPGQGEMLAEPIANLVAEGPVEIGNSTAAWSNDPNVIATLVAPASSSTRKNGECVFSFAYATGNVGGADATPTLNRLSLTNGNGLAQFEHNLPALGSGTESQFKSTISLPPGLSTLILDVDEPNLIEEGENLYVNLPDPNHYSVRINVTGSCT